MAHLVASALNNQIFLGLLSSALILVPIGGIWAIHKYNWQHWAPFNKHSNK